MQIINVDSPLDKIRKCDIVLDANALHLHLELFLMILLVMAKKGFIMEIVIKIGMDAFIDTIKLVPFLLLTYLAMEYLEHKTGEKTNQIVKRAGQWGPAVGGLAGAMPQCGFSVAASNLYAGKVITLGTLLAIYLSTSDEMLPILISEHVSARLILGVLAAKVIIGALAGFIVDFLFNGKKEEHLHIHEICEEEHCHCERGILHPALNHTIKITIFILLITVLLNAALHFAGEDALAGLMLNRPFLGPVLAGIVGLIPNCAASVVITQLYVQGTISAGTMMAGLLTGAGTGLLVLFRVSHNHRENLKVMGLLYLIGVLAGIAIEMGLGILYS